jgi:phenylpropionate dioxygenase-like ring-hydroxylating dioxygenase large terminal subunit
MRTASNLKVQSPAHELGAPLAPWTYSDPDLAREEYERLIRGSWQFVCHESEVAGPGAYATLDLWRDSILVLRGADNVLRAFQNACRHRAMPLLSGTGQCKGRVTCPYHAWSYRLDGSLAGVAAEHTFPGIDKSELGLRQLGLEVFHGLVFARIAGEGPSVAEQWGALAKLIEPYRVAEMVRSPRDNSQTWKANWKIAIDNNQENYHVPVGHPGYHRLLDNDMTGQSSGKGVALSFSRIRAKPSTNWSERMYQRLLPAAEFGLTRNAPAPGSSAAWRPTSESISIPIPWMCSRFCPWGRN